MQYYIEDIRNRSNIQYYYFENSIEFNEFISTLDMTRCNLIYNNTTGGRLNYFLDNIEE